jgi:uncharacterized protein YkwD
VVPRFVTAPRPALTLLCLLLPALLAAACSDSKDDDALPPATSTGSTAVAGALGETFSASLTEISPTASPVASETPVLSPTARPELAPSATPTLAPASPTPASGVGAEAPVEMPALAVEATATPAPTETPPPLPTATLPASTATPVPPPPTGTTAAAPAVARAASAPTSPLASEEVALINPYRAANGRGSLRSDAALNSEALQYAKLLGDTNSFGHNGPDGSTPFTRFAAAGFGGAMCGEALAAGQTTAAEALQTWTTSPSHNAILLGANADSVGIGYYYAPNSTYKHYWVLVTGKAGASGCPG